MTKFFDITPLGGVNLLDDKRRIKDNECTRAKNLVPIPKGMIGKRPTIQPAYLDTGISFQGVETVITGTDANGSLPLSAFISPLTRPESSFSAFAASKFGVYENSSGSYAYSKAWGFTAPRAPTFLMYGTTLYCMPGGNNTSAGWKYDLSKSAVNDITGTSSGSSFTFQGTNNSFSPGTACLYRQRAVYGDLGPGYEHYLVISDAFTPDLIGNNVRATDGRAVSIGDRGERIVAVTTITQSATGSPTETALLVLKEYSAWLITGEPNQTTDTVTTKQACFLNMTVSRVSYDCGCVSAGTISTSPYGTFWCGPDDVWFFATGSLPVRVGSKIRPLLAEQPSDIRWRLQGAYHDGFYRLALFTPGNASADIPLGEQWWLDLRDGPPQNHTEARWWGPQIFTYPVTKTEANWLPTPAAQTGTNVFFRDQRPAVSSKLYDLLVTYNGIPNYNWEPVQYDCPGNRDISRGWNTALDGGVNDWVQKAVSDNLGCEVVYQLLTKEHDFGARVQQKAWLTLRVDYWTEAVNYMLSAVYPSEATSSTGASLIVGPYGLIGGADTQTALVKSFASAALYPDARVVGKTLTLEMHDFAGFTIDSSNDTFVAKVGSTYYAATMTHDIYYNLAELLDQLVSKLTAATGIVWTHDVLGPASLRNSVVTLTSASASTLCFVSAGGSITSAQLKTSRLIGSYLGYDVSANSSSTTGHAATNSVYYSQSFGWQINGLEAEVDLFNRGPA